MLGAIAGDIIGSIYEHNPIKTTEFPLFKSNSRLTDDTVLTIAVAEALVTDGNYIRTLEKYYYKYPLVPYGARFHDWAGGHIQEPYNSWGNGSAMRVSPVAYVHKDMIDVLAEAEKSAAVTHNHPEGIKGAKATAMAIKMALNSANKEEIKNAVETEFEYNLNRTLEDIRPEYFCDLSCQHTVPEAIICFLESTDFETAVRNAISLGGDADTMACICGSIAEAYYGGVPEKMVKEILPRLDERILGILRRFDEKFGLISKI